jgi:hypothetical protein
MKFWSVIVVLIVVAGVLAGCGGSAASPAGEQGSSDLAVAATGSYTSVALGTAYEGALPAGSQLALGTLELDGTENAVTPEQARTLLSLWQALQAGSLQSDAETNAVLAQIERAMTPAQLAAIAAMQLTVQDLGTWMQEDGGGPGWSGDGAPGAGGFAPSNGPADDEIAAMRATAQAGGGWRGGGGAFGPPGDLSEEDRAAMRATAEANGFTFGSGPNAPDAAGGQLARMAGRVVALLAPGAGR